MGNGRDKTHPWRTRKGVKEEPRHNGLHCGQCYSHDPQLCEALSLQIPADVLASYEQCDCPCHYEEDAPDAA